MKPPRLARLVRGRGREQQGRRLARGARHGEQDAGEHAREAAVGSTTLKTTRQRGAPSASADSRSELGTSSRITSAERITIGSISSESASEPL